VKTAFNITVKTGFFSVAGRFRLIQVLEVKYPRECESVPLDTGVCSIQDPFSIDFNVFETIFCV
jgi:hypothetical protein